MALDDKDAVSTRSDRLVGCLLGTALGDSIGLPFEGLSRRRVQRMLGDSPLEHRLIPGGRGLISDDTEQSCMVAQSLLAHPEDPAAFARSFGWRMRGWLLGLPAGVGFGTLRALLKLLVGVPAARSGVASAGNGSAMRVAILGAALADDPERLESFARASSRVTHSDERAVEGALVVARAAAAATRGPIEPESLLSELRATIKGEELSRSFEALAASLGAGESAEEFARALGLSKGVTGYVNHCVPVALHCWLRQPTDFRGAISDAVRLGGDTDTTAAVVGGLCGAGVGSSGLPADWQDGLAEWPRSRAWMQRLAERLATLRFDQAPPGALGLAWPGLIPRNAVFLAIVLTHGFRRLLPPY